MKKIAIIFFGLLVGVGGGLVFARGVVPKLMGKSQQVNPSPTPLDLHTDFHQHFDLRIVVDGKLFDLSDEKYQSSTYVYRDEHTHLHDGNGSVVHLHQPGTTLGGFLETLGIKLSDECFTVFEASEKKVSGMAVEEKEETVEAPVVVENHCKQAEDGKSLVVMVNGTQQLDGADYKLHDLDKVLIYFGTANQTMINDEMALVSDDACLYSETCPKRGKPPVENCTASADTPCVVVE